jgi:Flp pilus assembly protein TadG
MRRGSAMLEFTLTGVPLLFVIVSLGWMSMGMWQYHTLAEAVNSTARAAAVHGAGCAGQACATTVAQTAQTLAGKAIGVPASAMNVTLTSSASTVTCNPLSSCYSNSAAWPSLAGNTAVTTDISITASYQFSSPISFLSFISLSPPEVETKQFAAVTLAANSTQAVVN